MTTYYHVKFGGLRVQVEGLGIMQNINIDASNFGYSGFRERFSPVRRIDISAYRYHGSNVRKGFQYAWIADVTGMNDELRAAEGLQGFRAQQSVSI